MQPPRTIFYTGKGGVGKTSVAAATALRAAAAGMRTIVVSTDPAHSLSDSLGREVGPDPTRVAPMLCAQEVEARREMERNWGTVRRWMGSALAEQGVSEIAAEELTVPPGVDELFSLLEVQRHHRSGEYDLIIVDCAPTGETLRLLSFPEVARWWLEKVVPREGLLVGAARPLARSLLDLELPGSDVLAEVHGLVANLVSMNAILRDRSRTSVRLVMSPDRMVVAEAKRTFTYLNLYGYLTDAVIVNRILPPETGDGYFGAWRERQTEQLAEIRDGFLPIPILTGRLLSEELLGTAMLERFGEEIFAAHEAGALLHSEPRDEFSSSEDGHAVVRVRLPFAERESLSLKRSGSELIVSAGRERRTMILPPALADREVATAELVRGVLEVRFADVRSTNSDDERSPAIRG
ncbi:MAG: ArsA family ATPase [Solirubrobacterales bacterium]|nr:ArsA family ATPase [Solirubrobacterales bacterium]